MHGREGDAVEAVAFGFGYLPSLLANGAKGSICRSAGSSPYCDRHWCREPRPGSALGRRWMVIFRMADPPAVDRRHGMGYLNNEEAGGISNDRPMMPRTIALRDDARGRSGTMGAWNRVSLDD